LPSIIAKHNQHRYASDIFVMNLLIGWTMIGWLILLFEANTEKGATIIKQ